MRLNIHHKITLILSITVAIIFSGVYFYLNKNLKEYAFDRIQSNLLKEVSFAKIYIEDAYSPTQSLLESDKIADKISEILEVRTTIIKSDGTVIGDSDLDVPRLKNIENHISRIEIQNAITHGVGESHRYSTTLQKDMLYVAKTFGKDKPQGFIRLAIPLVEINIISNKLKSLLLLALFFAFIFTILIGSSAFIFISKPIKEISSLAQEIAKGNFSKRTSFSTNDEIGDLSKAVNYMSEEIKAKIEEVISNKSRFETVLLSMSEGTMVVDKKGNILLMNKTLSQFFKTQNNILGKKPLEVIRNIEIQEITNKVLRTQNPIASQEIIIHSPEERTFHIHAAPVLRGEELDGAVLVFHEITELRKLENIRKDFVANASHEIRTPLTSIKGYAETLLDGAIDDKNNAIDFLKIISTDSNRLVQLVDDLLDLSRIESDKLNLEIKPRSLESIVDRVFSNLKEQSAKNHVSLLKDISKSLSKVNVDESSIAQVFLNLINNAIKYNNDNGSVTVSAEDQGGFIRIDIIDTGIGIPQEDLPRIFERFYRVDKARSRELGGTGLGLAIVKHIVQSHNGDVFVTSQLEKGSTFSFTLPKA